MPIFEFACPKCRRIYSFLSRRIQPGGTPACPKCGSRKLTKEISRFALLKGAPEPSANPAGEDPAATEGFPNFDDPRVAQTMGEIERDMDHLDENNPRHMAHMLRKMQQLMPTGSVPKEMEVAIKRLEAGEDPEKIEADMGDVLGDFMGEGQGGGQGAYTKDEGLYDY